MGSACHLHAPDLKLPRMTGKKPMNGLDRRSLMKGAAALALSTATPAMAQGQMRVPSHAQAVAALTPPEGSLLHGTFPGGFTGEEDDITLAQVTTYERVVGQHLAWVYFSHNWFHGRRFPMTTARWILAHGSTPYVRLMMRSDSEELKAEPTFTLARIAQGDFDRDLERWGRDAAALGVPILAEFGTEMNGEWFRWNGRWNGGEAGPAIFRAAYRHIVEVTRRAGGNNIVWVFHINHADAPQTDWNRFENYYPGDDVMDWLGVSLYSMLGPTEDEPTDFVNEMDEVHARLRRMAPDKPVIVAEFGTDIHNRLEPAVPWASRALMALVSGRWPEVIGFSWWNESWDNEDESVTDLRVWKDPALAAEFRRQLATARLVTHR